MRRVEHVGMFFMLWVLLDFLQAVIASEASAIIRRAGVFARDALRIFHIFYQRHFFFKENSVCPSVAEVILIRALLHDFWKPVGYSFFALVLGLHDVKPVHIGIR